MHVLRVTEPGNSPACSRFICQSASEGRTEGQKSYFRMVGGEIIPPLACSTLVMNCSEKRHLISVSFANL